MSMKKKR